MSHRGDKHTNSKTQKHTNTQMNTMNNKLNSKTVWLQKKMSYAMISISQEDFKTKKDFIKKKKMYIYLYHWRIMQLLMRGFINEICHNCFVKNMKF